MTPRCSTSRLVFLCTCCLGALFAGGASAPQAPEARVERDVAVRMRDGVVLRADVYRPALQRGTRYVRTPNLDDLKAELFARYNKNTRKVDREEGLTLIGEEGDKLRGWLMFMDGMDAEAHAAMRWIAILHPSFRVAWLDGDGNDLYELFLYDPATGKWEDA